MDAWLRGTALLPQPDNNSNEKGKAVCGANHVPGTPITWLAGAPLGGTTVLGQLQLISACS